MSGEDLNKLAAQADALGAAEAAQNDQAESDAEQAAAAPDLAAEVAALIGTVAAMLAPAFPSLGVIYSEATCAQLGKAAAPVMEKYGLSTGGLFERWGAEITLAAVALPVGVATVQGVKADLAARKKAAEQAGAAAPDDAPAAAPAPEGGTPGQLVIKPA